MAESKACSYCGTVKPLSEYHNQTKAKDGKQHRCKTCAKELASKWYRENKDRAYETTKARRARNPDAYKAYMRTYYKEVRRGRDITRFGITPEDYERMLADQGSRCAICGTSETGKHAVFHIDHDHRCCDRNGSCGECVRGLLCNNCNGALGLFKDDPDILRRAIEYLTR